LPPPIDEVDSTSELSFYTASAGSGTMLAEASVFSERYHCDAIAAETSQVAEFPRGSFLKLINSDPAFAATWMEHLAHQVQSARLRAEILTLKTVSQRLDAWLAFGDGKLPRRGERSILAKQIGVSPEALYREIGRRKE
jgi:CRP-like cAMP-binding protein